MNIIEAIQKAENGKLITNNFLNSINHVLKYVQNGVFFEYVLIDGELQYKYEVRKFSTADILCNDWKVINILSDEKGISNDFKCDCGKEINPKYDPCCSLECWHKKYN